MKFLEKFFNKLIQYLKILTLWDLKSNFSRKQQVKMTSVLLLNVINSSAKVLAPASLGKAVEMIALSEEKMQIGEISLGAKDLLIVSVFFSCWVKADTYIKKYMINDVESTTIKKNAMKLIKMSHQIPLEKHAELRPDITKTFLDIINLHSKLGSEVLTVVLQVIIDIIFGTSLIWRNYGNLLGCEFLVYSLIDIMVLNHLVDLFTQQSENFHKANKALHKFLNHEYEILNYEETVRMFNHEELEIELSAECLHKYIKALQKYFSSELRASIFKFIPFLLANIIPLSFVFKDRINVNDLDDFIFLLSYINIFGGNIFNLNSTIKSCLRAVNSIEAMKKLLLKGQEEIFIKKRHLKIDKSLLGINPSSSPEIVFENVTFTYPEQANPTLKDLNFRIPSGKKFGIIGHSNAGKSTIIKLLYGIISPQAGTIKVNGKNINEISRDQLSMLFSCVPQNVIFFQNKSLKYNVLYGNSRNQLLKKYLSREKEKKLFQTEVSYGTLNTEHVLEEGFATAHSKADRIFSSAMEKVKLKNLDNNAANKKSSTQMLSGGQRQRASLARALVRNSSIFILDEATTSLDSKTQKEVLENVKEVINGRTCIIVAHQLSTVKDADDIIVLEHGAIVEQGNHEHLMRREGVYYNYWQLQAHH